MGIDRRVALALFTFFLNWGNVALNDRYLKDALKSEITTELVKEQQNKIDTAPVEDRIAAVEQKLRQLDESVKRLAARRDNKRCRTWAEEEVVVGKLEDHCDRNNDRNAPV